MLQTHTGNTIEEAVIMKTSYFSKSGKDENAVAISQKVPPGYNGRTYKKLAPPWELVRKYKSGSVEEKMFEQMYRKEVLNKLDSAQVVKDLGADAVLLCWEGSDKFCHRRIVAMWLEEELGIDVKEL